MLDEARAVAERPRMRPSVAVLAVLGCIGCSGCSGRKNDSPPGRDTERTCNDRVSIYKGSIDVDTPDYVQHVMRGDDVVEEVIAGLDHVVSKAPRIDFTLDYPFEKPFTGSVTGEITLRGVIDAVRSGFRHMYGGTTQRDIPNMENKSVTGPYGSAFHVIGDLVIERIDLCDGRWLELAIGS
jgi:hypothetical protein